LTMVDVASLEVKRRASLRGVAAMSARSAEARSEHYRIFLLSEFFRAVR
jgi:hypothetical protein